MIAASAVLVTVSIVAQPAERAGADDVWQVVAPGGEAPDAIDQFAPGWFALAGLMDTYPVSYRRNADGSVRVRGGALSMGAPIGQRDDGTIPVFRLGCGYRPSMITFASISTVRVDENLQPSGVEAAAVQVHPDGTVALMAPALIAGEVLRGGAIFDFTIDADKIDFPGADCDDRNGTTIYVAPELDPAASPPQDEEHTGSPSSLGIDPNEPTTFRAAMERAVPGDHLLLRGGTYHVADTWHFNDVQGADGEPIIIANYPAETPTFDGSGMPPYVHDDPAGYRPMLYFTDARWLEVTGIEVQHSTFKGIDCTNCSDTRWANLDVHDNAEAGFVLFDRLDTGDASARNTFVDSDFHHNHDTWMSGEEADGLNLWNVQGAGNKVIRCRFFDNADDGLEQLDTQTPTLITDSWSFRNGINQWYEIDEYDPEEFGGDGSGFNLGGAGFAAPPPVPGETHKPNPIVDHVIVRSLAWENTQGISSGGNGGRMQVYHNTTFNNRELDYHLYKLGWPSDPDFEVDLRANVGYQEPGFGTLGLAAIDTPGTNLSQGSNSWDNPGLEVSAADLDLAPTQKAIAEGPRPFLGPNNLPVTTWLHLLPSSDLIDSAPAISSDPADEDYPPYPADPDPPGDPDHLDWSFFDDYGAFAAEAE